MSYEAVIGLEVHVHLATKSKLFCSCSTRFGQPPNTNVCEVCCGMPGALPVPNRQAIKFAALLGMAVSCSINRKSVFARKNYFYPDLPNGYQISQYDLPICEKGQIAIKINGNEKKIGITRIHMENDAGKNIHSQHGNLSFVDLNRAGVPLVEIVSEPDMRSGEEAVAYLKALHSLVSYLGISDGNMEEGSFRCDANVSIRPKGSATLGTRAELKNLNSFRHVQKAIDYEVERQEELLAGGKPVIQETRLYDADRNETRAMRGKEEAQDYRYFPDPDLLPVEISAEELEEWRKSLPELPERRVERFMALAGLGQAEAELLVQNQRLAGYFESACAASDPRQAAALLLGPASRYCNAQNQPLDPEKWAFGPEMLAELTNLIGAGEISAKMAADIFPEIFEKGISPKKYVTEKGLAQISDAGALEAIIEKIIEANPAEVAAFKDGKAKLLSFFVGQAMRETRGKANPALVNQLLIKKLS